jgi:DNA adenine methylase
MIKSPLNYIGGKTKLLKQILPLFPSKINKFIDLFAGGCNVGVNVNADKVYFNDNLTYLIEMYQYFQEFDTSELISRVEDRIKNYQLTKINVEGYNNLRKDYNTVRNPLDLFVLIAYSFNHQIRFNNKHEFNVPLGKSRSSFNDKMKINLFHFVQRLKDIDAVFSNIDFNVYNFDNLSSNDFVYCDPPYLITTGSYNDGKRGFKGWTEKEEIELLSKLDMLNKNKIPFALSNVIEHKGRKNEILIKWLFENSDTLIQNTLNMNYKNSNYQTNKESSVEVLITNYKPPIKQLNLL